ncbi:MAG: protein kinase [Vulcanimicrobiota bacterium]
MRLILSIEEGPGGKEQFVFDGHDTFIVGRSKKNTHSRLRGDPYISRHHFILELCPPSCYLKDLGSTNGTVVNGAMLGSGELRKLFHRDEIRVGKTMLRLELEEDEDEEGRESTISLEGEMSLPELPGGRLPSEVSENLSPSEAPESRPALELPGERAPLESSGGLSPAQDSGGKKSGPSAEPVSQRLCDTCGRDINEPGRIGFSPSDIYDGALFLCRDCAEKGPSTKQCYGEYEVLSLLGKGGMGEVWKGRHRRSGLLVALKTLLVQESLKNDAIRLFRREMKVMRELVHPNIIRFLEQGQREQEHYIVMELIKGGSVSDFMEKVRRRHLGIREGCAIVSQALEGLHHAHQRGFIHRDIKPQNILLHRSGDGWTAKISDFGLAKNFRDAGGSMITREGEAAGTIIFMAPEQLTDYRSVKPPADIYSMGVSLYYIISGKYHFPCPSPLDEIRAGEEGKLLRRDDYPDPLMMLLCEEPVPIEKNAPDIPAPLAAVVNKAVAKEESRRFGTAGEFREALLEALTKCG